MKRLALSIFLLLTITLVQGQQKKQQSSTKGKSSKGSSPSLANWGIGLRLGDPTGLTAKKYLSGGRALEINIGSSNNWGYDHRDEFYNDGKFKTYDYVGYKGNSGVSFQAHYLFHKDFPNAAGLQWYWGVGPQLRLHTFTYRYRYTESNAWVYVQEKVTNVDFGADGLIGLEYKIPNAPLSVFADVNLFLELVDDPFVFHGQGGVGIRYNFN